MDQASAADRRLAKRLSVPKETLLLSLVQVDFNAAGKPIVLSYEHHLTDAIDMIVVRRGPAAERSPK